VHASVSLGTPDTLQEVDRNLDQLAVEHSNPRKQITLALDPEGPADTPFVATDFRLGCQITVPDLDDSPIDVRVHELGVSETSNAERPVFPMTVNDVILDEQERIIQAITR
jgi:hypothetical protein